MKTHPDELSPPRSPAERQLDEIEQALQQALSDLGTTQVEYARAMAIAAADPFQEWRGGAALDTLRSRRDTLASDLGRLVLSWQRAGGRVVLARAGEQVTVEAPSAARVVATATTPVNVRTGVISRPATPAPAPAAPAAPAAPPSPPADLSALANVQIGPGWTRAVQAPPAPAKPEPQPAELRPVMALFGEVPRTLDTKDRVEAEIIRLATATASDQIGRWPDFPRDIQKSLVGMTVARARHLQDELTEGLWDPARNADLDRVFSAMTLYSKQRQPGFVFGLQRTHKPVHGSWRADALHFWTELQSWLNTHGLNPEKVLAELDLLCSADPDGTEVIIQKALQALEAGVSSEDPRLVRILTPRQELLKKHAAFKKLRKAIRDAEDQDREFDAELSAPAAEIPVDWAWWSLVRGRKAAIIGGDSREEARQRIHSAFGFQSLEWFTTDHSRNPATLAEAVRNGGIDFVIVLRRFIGHDTDRIVLPAARAANVPWVSVERGYGVAQIRLSIERFVSAPSTDNA